MRRRFPDQRLSAGRAAEYDPIWENGYYVNRGIERGAYDRVARTRIVEPRDRGRGSERRPLL